MDRVFAAFMVSEAPRTADSLVSLVGDPPASRKEINKVLYQGTGSRFERANAENPPTWKAIIRPAPTLETKCIQMSAGILGMFGDMSDDFADQIIETLEPDEEIWCDETVEWGKKVADHSRAKKIGVVLGAYKPLFKT